MRSHRDWPLLQIWGRQRDLKAWVKVENLRVARLEPVSIKNAPAAVVDLRFVHNEIGVSVPGCIVDLKTLEVRTQDALIWPFAVAEICKDEDVHAIEVALLDWLRAESSGLGFSEERVRRFGIGDQSFETARNARLLGAVPYNDIATELAAAHYAARFVPGKQVLTTNTLPNVAGLLAPSAGRSAIANLDAAECSVLTEWFGCEFLPGFPSPNTANLALISGNMSLLDGQLALDARIVDVMGIMPGESISIGPSRAFDDLVRLCEPSQQTMSTKVTQELAPATSLLPNAPVATGGSHGRILLMLREDALRSPGSDTDEAYALRELLRNEGFSVDVAVRPELYDATAYDLIHGFGLLSAPHMHAFFSTAKRAKIPTVITAFFEDFAQEGLWGARASRSLLDLAGDEESSRRVLALLSSRLVYVDTVSAHDRFDNGEEAARIGLLRDADLVIAHSQSEKEAIASYAQRTEAVAVSLPLVYREQARTSVAHLVPDQAYMFVHAPVEARQNVGLVLYAASALDIPCVFAGPILDRRLYRHIASRVSTTIAMIPECSAAELASIGESAAVYVDAAWIGDGTGRILRSLLHGVVPVVSQRRHLDEAFEEHVVRVDPASFDSLRNGMSEAWQQAGTLRASHASQKTASLYDVDAVFKTIVSAYAAASERCKTLATL